MSTLPYVAPIPIGSDVQYPIFMVCFSVILIELFQKKICLDRLGLYFLFIALVSFIYVNPFIDFDYEIRKRVGLLFSFVLFYTFRRYWVMVNPKYILIGIYINFTAAIAHYLNPGLFISIAGHVLRLIKISSPSGPRGVSGLAPEPGFLGAMAVYFILITYVFYREGRVQKFQLVSVAILSCVLVGLSKSGTGVLMLFALIGIYLVVSDNTLIYKFLFIVITCSFLWYVIYESGATGRGVYIARNIIEHPEIVFVRDTSVAMRGVAISVGLESLLQGNLLGHGVGTLPYVASKIIHQSYFGELFINVIDKSGGLLSSWAQYTVEMGGGFLVLLCWIYAHTNVKSHRYVIVVRSLSLFYLMASFSILFPPLWLMLACTDKFNTSHRRYV